MKKGQVVFGFCFVKRGGCSFFCILVYNKWCGVAIFLLMNQQAFALSSAADLPGLLLPLSGGISVSRHLLVPPKTITSLEKATTPTVTPQIRGNLYS
ncbi:hypothetical protein L6452_07875 [Arctium lappa]|uniref:Uncharacterized protein n=1 Tax=Arctium lappa TaxID=4217 RepID=A0ACB9EM56_ARCLA|nr:hypothetical protein L6452_07875 [Arctium lappa]